MKPSEKNLDHLRPLVDAVAFEVRCAVEGIAPAVEHATERGMRTYGAQVYPLLGNSTTATAVPPAQVIYAGACRVMGWSLTSATTTSAAAFAVYDGVDADGELRLIAGVTQADYAQAVPWFGPGGIAFTKGVYVAPVGVVNAPVVGSFFIYAAGTIR